MLVIGVIPARGGSKGLPGKNIKPINGKPMIGYVIEDALASKTLDRVLVSTDAEDIAAVAREFGAEVVIRPHEISGDTAALEDALRHATLQVESEDGQTADIVALMQANLPIRSPGLIDETVRKLIANPGFDSVASAFEAAPPPQWLKRAVDGALEPFMECASYRRQELEPLYMIDGAAAAVRREALFSAQGRSGLHLFLGRKIGYVLHDRVYAQDVDSPTDHQIAEALLKALQNR